MAYKLSDIIRNFDVDVKIEPYGNGHINDTYIAQSNPRYILQRINSSVFKHPEQVMYNIAGITEHLRKKISLAGGDTSRETLTLINTVDGKPFYKADDENYFRMYTFIENAVSYDSVENPTQLYEAARAFGRFQNMLSDYPSDKLFETIPDFHNTEKRFDDFSKSVKADRMQRLESVSGEVEFALSKKSETGVINAAIAEGSVPLRVTHNDTKLNNVMLDIDTGKGVCVIDLDTVMPGSLLYDYGDALRFGASSADEDETNLDKVWFDLELFEAFTKGFLSEVGSVLTEKEIELLPFSAKIMTYECGIRFLGDYLDGDTYFKISRPNQNLDRARAQFKLVSDIENKLSAMSEIVHKYI